MAVTMQDVRKYLDQDEVEYAEAQKLGPEALPWLLELVQGGDPGLASKATYLASLIESDHSAVVLEAAAASRETVVRVAAAAGIRNLSPGAAERVMELMRNDPDSGVRKVVVKSVSEFKSPQLAAKVQHMAERDPEPFVRELAASAAARMR